MLIFEGTKRWTIFPPHVSPLLRPSYRHGHDATFDADPHRARDGGGSGSGGGGGGGGSGDDDGAPAAADEPPLLRHLDRWEVTLQPGELLFVPAGAAHAVRAPPPPPPSPSSSHSGACPLRTAPVLLARRQVSNLSHTAAISANFVDATNLQLFTEELSVAALQNPEAARLLAQVQDPAFPAAMDLQLADLPWAEFKRSCDR